MALDLERIRSLANRVAASHGLAVVEVEYAGNPKHRALRIYIEKDAANRAQPASADISAGVKLPKAASIDQLAGISVDDCQTFSDDFGTVLDVEELIPGADYTLEVSSPGLDRKLHGRADYERFAGSLVKVRTKEPIEGNLYWQGRMVDVGSESLELEIASTKKKGKATPVVEKHLTIAFSNILKANLVPEF